MLAMSAQTPIGQLLLHCPSSSIFHHVSSAGTSNGRHAQTPTGQIRTSEIQRRRREGDFEDQEEGICEDGETPDARGEKGDAEEDCVE